MIWNNKKIPGILLVGSSILLTAFLCFWLNREYQIEKETLKKELNQVFWENARDVRDSFLQEMFFISIRDTQATRREVFSSISPYLWDSSRAKVMLSKLINTDGNELRVDSQLISGLIRKSTKFDDKFSDSIQITRFHSHGHRTTFIYEDSVKSQLDQDFPQLLATNIKRDLEQAELPLNVRIIKLDKHQKYLEENPNFITTRPTRLRVASGMDPHVALFSNYRSTLLGRMIPNIFLALFVISATLLSLVFIYRSLKKQQQLTTIKNDLISNIAHELKTPITTVGVALEAMQNFNVLKDPGRTEEYMDISKNELHRLGILVDKVINTAVFEKRELDIKPEVFDIELLIFDIIRSMKVQFEKFAAKVEFQNETSETNIQADKIHITNVIINLIDNAIKYSGENPKILIKLAKKGQAILLNIKDNGIGIDAEYKEKIFDKFFRVPNRDKHNVKGHGLGLNYVYNVVKRHSGSISVESTLGEGTNFLISLPDTNA